MQILGGLIQELTATKFYYEVNIESFIKDAQVRHAKYLLRPLLNIGQTELVLVNPRNRGHLAYSSLLGSFSYLNLVEKILKIQLSSFVIRLTEIRFFFNFGTTKTFFKSTGDGVEGKTVIHIYDM